MSISQGTQRLSGLFKGNAYSFLLMSGHICVDITQGGLAAALPFLVLQNGYSYAAVTALIFASNVSSAIIQPLFGWLGDKKARPWFMALGVFLSGIGIAGVGLASSYWLMCASAMCDGIGVAMLHPEGGRLANLVAGSKKALGVSIFSLGGQIGFCIGPIITVIAMTAFGTYGLLVFLIPNIPMSIFLLSMNKRLAAFGLVDPESVKKAHGQDRWGRFGLVLSTLSTRSIIYYASTSFIPLFLVGVFGQTEQLGSMLITVFALMGAFATLISSGLAKKIGTLRLLIYSFAILVVSISLFASSISLGLCIAMVLVIAFAVNVFNAPTIAYGQSFLPHHLGMASGLTFGVAVCIGGVVSPLLGTVGDIVGLIPVMFVLAGIACVGLLLSLLVARKDKQDRD